MSLPTYLVVMLLLLAGALAGLLGTMSRERHLSERCATLDMVAVRTAAATTCVSPDGRRAAPLPPTTED